MNYSFNALLVPLSNDYCDNDYCYDYDYYGREMGNNLFQPFILSLTSLS